MNELLELAKIRQEQAHKLIGHFNFVKVWESFGAQINLVGSLKTGLLIKRRDIDFHIYSREFRLEDSFRAMFELAQKPGVTGLEYKNLLNTEEQCLEWHLWCEDESRALWQIDMIHILKGSRYDGYFEKVAERILAVLSPESKLAILGIKNEIPDEQKVPGIDIYQAVIQDGVKDYSAFVKWQTGHQNEGINHWMP